jgi:hypothetical protein
VRFRIRAGQAAVLLFAVIKNSHALGGKDMICRSSKVRHFASEPDSGGALGRSTTRETGIVLEPLLRCRDHAARSIG